uniref:Uncharacterized protein n=1 Tax=Pseudomonas phage PACT201 TaxID=3230130 RepID=A0AAU8GSD0_9VIRU
MSEIILTDEQIPVSAHYSKAHKDAKCTLARSEKVQAAQLRSGVRGRIAAIFPVSASEHANALSPFPAAFSICMLVAKK